MSKRLGLFISWLLIAFGVIVYLLPVGYDMSAVVFAGLGAVLCFFTLCRKRTLRLIVAVLLVIGLGCFAVAEVPVVRDAHSDTDTDAPYLVVMGAGIRGTEPTLSMSDRLNAALNWLDAHPDGMLIVSGSQAQDEVTSEAAVMRDWLLKHGVNRRQILFEDQARSTLENIRYSLALIEQNGGDPCGRVAFVSSEYHLCRIRLIARHLGCEPVGIAAPTSEFTMKINLFIREAFALWQIWVFGPEA